MERIAILAGAGQLPIAIAKSVTARGGQVHLVVLGDGADQRVDDYPNTKVGWGRISRLLNALRTNGDAIVIAGAVSRPDLGRIKPDFGFIRHLPDILSMLQGGDDAILTRVVRFFERKGFVVKGVADVAPELVAPLGNVAGPAPSMPTTRDIERGLQILDAVSHLDIGQAIVVADGHVLAIEGAEGTDRMLERLSERSRNGNAPTGALVKAPKRGQELRIDLPTIGGMTVANAANAGLAAIAVHAGKALVLDQDRLAEATRAVGVSIVGIEGMTSKTALSRAPSTARWIGASLSRISPTDADRRDAAMAAQASTTLAAFQTGSAAAVVRRHVLAVAAAEGPVAMAERLATLRQWGGVARRQRQGAIAIRLDGLTETNYKGELERIMISAAAASLAGVAIIRAVGKSAGAVLPSDLSAFADANGLFLIEIADYP